MSAYVYRCYDAEGLLLYVGCTGNVKRRMAKHARGESRASLALCTLMVRYTTEGPYRDRATAEAAEQAAIASESPLLNIHHGAVPIWLNQRRVEQYLTERGLSPSVAGLHYCESCGILRGYHMPPGLCSDCQVTHLEESA